MAIKPEITIREATALELDVITNIGLSSLPADPAWSYRYIHAKEFAEDHYKYSRIRYSEYLANVEARAYAVLLAESPSNEDPDVTEIIAMSMWQLPGTHGVDPNGPTEIQKGLWPLSSKAELYFLDLQSGAAMRPPMDYSDRRDASVPRMKAFRSSIGQHKRATFDNVYSENQLNLMVLATRPEYQRRGAGSALLEWGIKKAKAEGLTITLFSSPQGLGLYKKMGFTQKTVARVQVEGEEAFLEMPMLVF